MYLEYKPVYCMLFPALLLLLGSSGRVVSRLPRHFRPSEPGCSCRWGKEQGHRGWSCFTVARSGLKSRGLDADWAARSGSSATTNRTVRPERRHRLTAAAAAASGATVLAKWRGAAPPVISLSHGGHTERLARAEAQTPGGWTMSAAGIDPQVRGGAGDTRSVWGYF